MGYGRVRRFDLLWRWHICPNTTALVASVADPKTFRSVATSRPGSGWFPNNTRAGVGIGSAVSANRGIAICAACSWPVHSPSFAMPRSTAPSIGPAALLTRRPTKVAAIALANKLARMAWAMMARGGRSQKCSDLKYLVVIRVEADIRSNRSKSV